MLTNDLAVHRGGGTGQRGGEFKEHVVNDVSSGAHLGLQELQGASGVLVTHKTNGEGVPDACRAEERNRDAKRPHYRLQHSQKQGVRVVLHLYEELEGVGSALKIHCATGSF